MRGRVLILVGAIILLAVVLIAVLMLGGGDGDKKEEAAATEAVEEVGAGEPTGQGTPAPAGGTGLGVENMVDIVIAIQDLPRGLKIPEDGVGLQPWPERALPEPGSYFTDPNEVIGLIARTDLFRGAPILRRQIVEDLRDIAKEGSDAAAILPPGLVGVAVPLDLSGVGQVAYGIQDGDYVDVILSFLFIDVDEAFQTRLPNNLSVITRLESGELSIGPPRQGRQEPSTLSPEGVLIGPSEATQRPRLVTQRTVENAFVVHVGYFPEGGNFIGSTPTPMEIAAPPPPPGEATPHQVAATQPPTDTPFTPAIITLGVTPQDALVLTWAVDSQIPITLVLRAAGDVGSTPTQAVTLQYMIQTFNITQPDTLPFALEPPITSVRRFDIGTLYSFLGKLVTEEE
jgi:Flp pilus assembly protein CpaB